MQTDIELDDNTVTVVGDSATILKCPDLVLDGGEDRRKGHSGVRRALVHGFQDELAVNCDGDYPGGTRIDSATTVKGTLTVRGNIFHTGELFILHRNGEEDLLLGFEAFRDLSRLSGGEVSVKKLILQEFEADPTLPGAGMKGVDVTEELLSLRAQVRTLSERLHALDGK